MVCRYSKQFLSPVIMKAQAVAEGEWKSEPSSIWSLRITSWFGLQLIGRASRNDVSGGWRSLLEDFSLPYHSRIHCVWARKHSPSLARLMYTPMTDPYIANMVSLLLKTLFTAGMLPPSGRTGRPLASASSSMPGKTMENHRGMPPRCSIRSFTMFARRNPNPNKNGSLCQEVHANPRSEMWRSCAS